MAELLSQGLQRGKQLKFKKVTLIQNDSDGEEIPTTERKISSKTRRRLQFLKTVPSRDLKPSQLADKHI